MIEVISMLENACDCGMLMNYYKLAAHISFGKFIPNSSESYSFSFYTQLYM